MQGANPCHQFARFEGLGQVVVGALFQAKHPVIHLAPGGEQDDRRRVALAQFTAETEAVAIRQHHVEDDDIEALLREQRLHPRGIGCGGGFEPLATQVDRQGLTQLAVVVDE